MQQAKAHRRNACFFLVAAIWIALDRITKVIAIDALQVPGATSPLIDGILQFRLVYNRGAAWGIFSDSTVALGVFSVIVCVAILVFMLKSDLVSTMPQAFALALVFGGGIGNAIDRFVYNRVTDFIEATFIDFPVFNVADIGVTCGVILFLILMVAMLAREARSSRGGGRDE